ncbi:hypothetical protein IMCC3317_19880 [Kordia antarctica]|uniref:Uncharacterized protein n=1 Tax=Kordia antarctica TaxID=1218801 RepID=A0A7L4ZJ43_9FLAO|nr:hypothetical protein [Kordia antarctica]QHI36625.1 hypothetical protein IMCC3317_19880 [Kordia antarctica]
MKNHSILLLSFCFAFANVHAQEFSKPSFPSPEKSFYTYLDNENISDPSKYNGNVKKVIRTFKEYEIGVDVITLEKTTMFVNTKGEFEKSVKREYSFGVESSKQEINHLETPKAIVKTAENKTIKIIKNELNDDLGYEYEEKGDDYYVYENDRLTAFYNNNDSVSYTYDEKNRLISVKYFESLLTEEYNHEDESSTLWRSQFEDKALERITYENGRVKSKEMYDKFGEVIDIYKTTYTYSADNLVEKFQTVYTRYLYDYYDTSIPIEKQKYMEFPVVGSKESIQTGTFQYSEKNKIRSYIMENGDEKEVYKITFDANHRMHIVAGNLQFYQKGNLQKLEVEYEYLYDEKGNPKSIISAYYIGGEKMIHKETTFEIEYY